MLVQKTTCINSNNNKYYSMTNKILKQMDRY